MFWLIVSSVMFAVASFLGALVYGYQTLSGGVPFGSLVMYPILGLLALIGWICLGAAWERLQDEGCWQEPMKIFWFAYAIIAIPIVLHQLSMVWSEASAVESYRFWISGCLLVGGVTIHLIKQASWPRLRRGQT